MKVTKNHPLRTILLYGGVLSGNNVYATTNAPDEEIRAAIRYKDAESKTGHDFELVQKFLEAKGYTFKKAQFDTYIW